MAIFSSHTSMVQRSKGQNAVASAAYNARTKLTLNIVDRPTGIVTSFTYDYSDGAADVAYSQIHAPEGITADNAAWIFDREQLWNKAESAEVRVDAQIARKIMLALPQELTIEQNTQLVKEFVDEYLVPMGMVVDVNVHNDDIGNPHVHLMLTTRQLVLNRYGEYEFSKVKNREWGKTKFVEYHREASADLINKYLARHGFDARVSHLSYKDRGIDLTPGVHEGPARYMKQAELKELNAQIAFDNATKILETPELVLDKIAASKPVFTSEDIAKALEEVMHKGLKLDGLSDKSLEEFNSEIATKFMGLYAKVMSSDNLSVVVEEDLKGRTLYAKTKRINLEKSYIELVQELHSRNGHAIELTATEINDVAVNVAANNKAGSKDKKESEQPALNEEQTRAVIELMAGRDLAILEGLPGTGKTMTMREIVRQSKKAGYTVIGVAPSSSAALQLEKEAGIIARNASLWRKAWLTAAGEKFDLVMRDDYFLEDKYQEKQDKQNKQTQQIHQGQNPYLTDKHIMIIDEASMCDLTALHYLLSEASRAGAKVIMVGDRNQLSAVGYGGGLQRSVKECGSVQLVQTQRQQNPLHREATVLLAQYRIEEALKIYQDTNSLIIDESELQSNYRLINDYVDSYLARTKNSNKNNSKNSSNKSNKVVVGTEAALVAEKSVAICVYTNEEARFFNNEIRARLAEAGITRGQEYEVRVGSKLLRLAKGEQIVFTQNLNHIGSSGIYNGEVGTVVGVRVYGNSDGNADTKVSMGDAILTVAVNKADGSQEIVEIDTARVDKGQILDYGYAVTAHKLQGASIEEVFVKYCKNIGYEAFNVMMTRHREALKLYAAKETLMENILQRVEVDSNKAKARYEFEIAEGKSDIELIALSISASKKTNNSFASDYAGMGSSAEDELLKKYLETRKLAQELVSEISSWQLKQQRVTGNKPAMYMHPLWQQFMQIRGERDLVASEIVKDYSRYEERVIQMGINYSTLKKQASGDKWYKVAEKHTKLHTNIYYQELITAIEENKPRQAKIAWKKLQQDIAEIEARFRDASVKLKELKDDQQGLELDIAEERKFQEVRLPSYLGQIYAGEKAGVAAENEVEAIAGAILSKWGKLQEQHGQELAANMVQNKPSLLGNLRGVGLGKFLGLSVKRMYAIVHIERLGKQLMAYERSKVIEQELIVKQQDMSYVEEIRQIEAEISRLRAMLTDRIDEEFLNQVGTILDRGNNGSSRVSRFDLEKIDLKALLSSDKLEEIKLDILQAEIDADEKQATTESFAMNKEAVATEIGATAAPKKARIKFADVNARLTASDQEKLFYKYAKAINPYDPIEKRGNSIRCGSLHMDIRKGLWHRFSSGDGGNIYSFIQQATNVSKAEALEIVAGEIGITPGYQANEGWHKAGLAKAEIISIEEKLRTKAQIKANENDWEPYSRVPANAPAMDIEKNFAYLAKTKNYLASYEYRNSEGELIGYTVRFSSKENPEQKEVLPVAYCHSPSRGQDAWRMKGFSDNGYKPIYGAEKLGEVNPLNPNTLKPVLIVEGEKTADRAQELMPEYNVITWLGGAKAVAKVNWQQLKNREIVIWPDNDKAGIEAATSIKHEIDHVNGFRGLVTIIDTQQLDLPAKWDLADELPEHLPLNRVKAVISGTAVYKEELEQYKQHDQQQNKQVTKQVAEWSEYLGRPEHIYAMEYAARSEGFSYEHEYMTLKSGIYREILAHIAVSSGKGLGAEQGIEENQIAKGQDKEKLYQLVEELELGYKELKNEYELSSNREHGSSSGSNSGGSKRDELKFELVRDISIWQQLKHGTGKLVKTEADYITKTVAKLVDELKIFNDGDKRIVGEKLYQTISGDKWQAELAKVNQEKTDVVKEHLKESRKNVQYIKDELDSFKQAAKATIDKHKTVKTKATNVQEMIVAIKEEQTTYVKLGKEYGEFLYKVGAKIGRTPEELKAAIQKGDLGNAIDKAAEMEEIAGIKQVEKVIKHVVGNNIKSQQQVLEYLKSDKVNTGNNKMTDIKQVHEDLRKICHEYHNQVIDENIKRIKQYGHINYEGSKVHDIPVFLIRYRDHYEATSEQHLLPLRRIHQGICGKDDPSLDHYSMHKYHEYEREHIQRMQERRLEKEMGGPGL